MARGRVVKAIILGFAWSMFISVLFVILNKLKSVYRFDLWEGINLSNNSEILTMYAGDIFFVGLCFFFIIVVLRKIVCGAERNLVKKPKRKVCIPSNINGEDVFDIIDSRGERLRKEFEIDISIDPGLTSLPFNVYHRYYQDRHPKKDED